MIWQDFKLFWLVNISAYPLDSYKLISHLLLVLKLSWFLLLFPYWHCVPSPVPCALPIILQLMKKITYDLEIISASFTNTLQ